MVVGSGRAGVVPPNEPPPLAAKHQPASAPNEAFRRGSFCFGKSFLVNREARSRLDSSQHRAQHKTGRRANSGPFEELRPETENGRSKTDLPFLFSSKL